jgi:hypothetical protein
MKKDGGRSGLNYRLLLGAAIPGLVSSLVLTGFFYGFFACHDCGWGAGGWPGRLWVGFVHVVLTVITFGRPWTNEGGSSSTDLQPVILVVFLVITYFIYRRKVGRLRAQ